MHSLPPRRFGNCGLNGSGWFHKSIRTANMHDFVGEQSLISIFYRYNSLQTSFSSVKYEELVFLSGFGNANFKSEKM